MTHTQTRIAGTRIARAKVTQILALAILTTTGGLEIGQLGAEPGEPADAPRPRAATQGADANNPGGLMDRAADSGAQVYVDDSFQSVERLRVAIRLASQNRPKEAIPAFQDIIDNFGQKLVYLNNDSYVSITDYVREKLLAVPAVQQGMYDQFYGTVAEGLVETAIATRDLAGLVKACDRYYPSSAAHRGLGMAAEWYFERGEFSTAGRTWQMLMTHPKSKGAQAELLFRASLAEKLSGNAAGAKRYRDRLAKDFKAAMGVVDGEKVDLLKVLEEKLAGASWERITVAEDEWPTFGGAASRDGLLKVNSSAGARLWGVDLEDPAVSGVSKGKPAANPVVMRSYGRQPPVDPNQQSLNSFPALSNGTLFIHTGERVVALSANAGSMLWAYPAQPIPRMNEQERRNYANNYGIQFATNTHDSVTVYGDNVYALMPAPTVPQTTRTPNYYPAGLQVSTRIVSINRSTGQEVWSRVAHTVKTDAKGTLTFIGSPLVTRQGVFVMARKQGDASFTQMYLVRLDRETGEPTWACYICSGSAGGYYGYMAGNQKLSLPTLVDDVLYVSTNQGADCAIDANAGRIIWLQITESAKKLRDPSEMYQPVLNTTPVWKINPPLVYGDKVVTQESGGNIRVYERWNGRLLASLNRKKFDNPDVLAGLIGSNLVVVGTKVSSIDLDRILDPALAPTWTENIPASNETGKQQGRPFLARNSMYIPFEKGLLIMDPTNGKTVDYALWPKNEKDQAGKPGNLLVTSEQIVVVTDKEVTGYSRWETARDNRLLKIKEKPTDPEPYLSLAEIAFRTNHYELAVENMGKSVELATAPGSGASADLLGRLYRTNLNFAEQLLGKADEAQRDSGRFYYTQCKLTARTPEQQAEWRLCMAQLSLAQKNVDEAATLFNEVMTDAGMRQAPYQRGEAVSRAGVTAEQNMRTLVEKNTPEVYKRFEDQAAVLLATAETAKDVAGFAGLVDAYPNSQAAIKAAGLLAGANRERADWAAQVKSLRWLYTRVNGDAKAQVTADLAQAHFQMKRFAASVSWTERGLRQHKDYKWTDAGTKKAMTFAGLKEQLREAGALVSDGRLATLPIAPAGSEGKEIEDVLMDGSSILSEKGKEMGITGALMMPIEAAVAQQRPEVLLINNGGKIRIFKSETMSELTAAGPIDIGNSFPVAVLGYAGDYAVLLQAKKMMFLNMKTLKLVPTGVPFETNAAMMQTQWQTGMQVRNFAVQQAQMAGQMNLATYVDSEGTNLNNPYIQQALIGLDSELLRIFAFNQLSRMGGRDVAFANIRIVNDKVIVIVNREMMAYDIATGKPAWVDSAGKPVQVKLPEGHPSVILGNEDLITVQMDNIDRATPTYYVVDAESGKFRKQIKLSDERGLWRTMSEDGTLFVVTDQAVSAYDLFADHSKPLWRRDDLRTKFATATALSMDGLIFVNANSELLCLSQEGGETRWPQPRSGPIRLTFPTGQGQQSLFLRSVVDGDTVIFQSSQGMASYYTYPQASSEDQKAWDGAMAAQRTPPLNNFQLSDPYVVVLASGPMGSTQRAVNLMFYNRKGGVLKLNKELVRSPNDREGPQVRSWQVLDNGIALEFNGKTYMYRGKKQ